MRLIDAHKLRIQEFTGDPPPYAILSHRWGHDDKEVAYHEFHLPEVSSRPGYKKIQSCCDHAIADGLHYVWVDTCCIDKRSSAELSEAINSMFNWYRDAAICYAYLEDVDSTEKPTDHHSQFGRSAWFTRGWTLQELLAPSVVVFFTATWKAIGTRNQLKTIISLVTNISLDFFRNGDLGRFSVAQKMSWASRRSTKRLEDEAYCLLGIFGVNMPLLYGEGIRAFRRLQEEIMKVSDDPTIFAWVPSRPGNSLDFEFSYASASKLDGGLLSPSTSHFANSGNIVRTKYSAVSGNSPHVMTNKGLRITLPVIEYEAGPDYFYKGNADTRDSKSSRDDQQVLARRPGSPTSQSTLIGNVTPIDPQHTGKTQPVEGTVAIPSSPPSVNERGFYYAILDCCFEHDKNASRAFLSIIIEGHRYVYGHERLGTYSRVNHAQGFTLMDISRFPHVVPHAIYVKAKDGALMSSHPWTNRRDGRLVLIEPLPRIAAGFELRETIPKVSWKLHAETNSISLRLRKGNFSYGRVALMFSHTSGNYGFLLIIKPTTHVDDGEDRYDVTYTTNLNRKEQKNWKDRFYDKFVLGGGGFFQEGPNGTRIRLRLSVQQPTHALLLKLTDNFEGAKSF